MEPLPQCWRGSWQKEWLQLVNIKAYYFENAWYGPATHYMASSYFINQKPSNIIDNFCDVSNNGLYSS